MFSITLILINDLLMFPLELSCGCQLLLVAVTSLTVQVAAIAQAELNSLQVRVL